MAKAKKNSWEILMAREIAKVQKERDHYKEKLLEMVNDVSSYVIPEVYGVMVQALAEKYKWSAEEICELLDTMTLRWNEYCQDESIESVVQWAEEWLGLSLHCIDGDKEKGEGGDNADET